MMRLIRVFLLTVCFATHVSLGFSSESVGGNLELLGAPDGFVKALMATVLVVCPDGSHGSGALIRSADGQLRVITNAHVVREYREVGVIFWYPEADHLSVGGEWYVKNLSRLTKESYFQLGTVIRCDSRRDIAIMKLDRIPATAEAIELSATLSNPGDTLHIVGNPADRPLFTYAPVVGGYAAEFKRESDNLDFNAIWLWGQVWRGNSGGPAVNDRGQLVGIVQGGREYIAVAVSVDDIRDFLNETPAAALAAR
jgi:S1-C subfamily serine protease